MLKITLVLGFCLDNHDELGTCLHQLEMANTALLPRRCLWHRFDQHQVIADGNAAPSLYDLATLEATDNLSLPSILAVAQGSHARLRVVLVALFGTDHHTLL